MAGGKHHHRGPVFKGKKGVCLKMDDDNCEKQVPKVLKLNPHWNYSWASERVKAQPDDLPFVPMLWSGKSHNNIAERIEKLHKTDLLFGFNEPDMKEQSNMTVEQAISAWPLLEETGLPLVSPSCAKPLGEWMEQFMEAVEEKGLRVDFVGVHWYGGASPEAFKTFLRNVHEKYGRPIIVTEFAPADWTAKAPEENKHSRQAVLNFMKKTLPWLEETDWIAGYAWFSFGPKHPNGTSSALFDEKFHLTPLGKFYSSVTADNPEGDQSITV